MEPQEKARRALPGAKGVHRNVAQIAGKEKISCLKPLKKSKVQQEATELLANSWATLPEETQTRLQALGKGPSKPEEPDLKNLLKTHMDALPQQVQEIVSKLTTPEPITGNSKAKLPSSRTCPSCRYHSMESRPNMIPVEIQGVGSRQSFCSKNHFLALQNHTIYKMGGVKKVQQTMKYLQNAALELTVCHSVET